jgi:hypothetical protein
MSETTAGLRELRWVEAVVDPVVRLDAFPVTGRQLGDGIARDDPHPCAVEVGEGLDVTEGVLEKIGSNEDDVLHEGQTVAVARTSVNAPAPASSELRQF